MARPDRIAERLNRALHNVFAEQENLYLLGEDVEDPYGGAFKVTKGLSTAHPGRVIGTPISENGFMGIANGLVLGGNKAIVEIMFCDFATLAFDPLINFTSKSVGMYGRPVQMPVVVRIPVGGRRGYGPTHSQSLQKHFIGIPHLALFELSAYHDPGMVLRRALERTEPSIIFEPKHLYGAPQLSGGTPLGDGNWIHVAPATGVGAKVVILSPGGTADLAIGAARQLAASGEAAVHVAVPAQLYPLDLDPVADLLRDTDAIFTLEESTAGGTWGAEVAARVHQEFWSALRRPVTCLQSADSVLPAAPHLERRVLVQKSDVVDAVRIAVAGGPPRGQAKDSPDPQPEATAGDGAMLLPKLNNNDDSYLLLAWLVDDGADVTASDVVAEIETSKAVEELAAATTGTLRHEVKAGEMCAPGDRIARITSGHDPGPATIAAGDPNPAGRREEAVSPAQRQVGSVVTRSRREIPDGYLVYKASLDAVYDALTEAPDNTLLDVLVKVIGDLRPRFPRCFAELTADGARLLHAEAANVGVTFDAGSGLFIPVLRDVESRGVDDLADELMDHRMRALSGRFAESDLRGATIAVSWNSDPGVVSVQPVIPPGLACVVAVGGDFVEWAGDGSGTMRPIRTVNLALAYDHRIVNGAGAVAFLAAVNADLNDHSRLSQLLAHAGTGDE